MQKLTSIVLITSLLGSSSLNAAGLRPNDVPQLPGWSVWKPRSEIPNAGFSSGFSNSELGGFLDFESNCAAVLNTPNDATPYWFRISNSVSQIGTGKVQFGCWKEGEFINDFESTAVTTKRDNVTCLQVRVPSGDNLRIRSEPSIEAKVIGSVRNGARVVPDSFPATIVEEESRNWVAIRSPQQGWISNDLYYTPGNLFLCEN